MTDVAQKVLSLGEVRRRLQRGPLDRATIATLIAEQLSDDEFDALTKQQRKALSLARLGLSVKESSEAVDLEYTTVHNTLIAARKRLALRLEKERAE